MLIILFVLGLVFGSFSGAVVWRLHKQSTDKKSHKRYSISKGRSVCELCGHTLNAVDLIPVFSWLALGGKCRYCDKKLSWQLPAIELVCGLLFSLSYIFWPYTLSGASWLVFAVWLAIVVLFVMLTTYDLKWMLLPNKLVMIVTLFALALVTGLAVDSKSIGVFINAAIGGAVLFCIFWLLFQVSKGKWIGGGDVKLAIALGLVAGTSAKAILLVFIASLVGTIIIFPLLITKKLSPKTRIPFGPLLMVAGFVVFLFGSQIIHWYIRKVLYL